MNSLELAIAEALIKTSPAADSKTIADAIRQYVGERLQLEDDKLSMEETELGQTDNRQFSYLNSRLLSWGLLPEEDNE